MASVAHSAPLVPIQPARVQVAEIAPVQPVSNSQVIGPWISDAFRKLHQETVAKQVENNRQAPTDDRQTSPNTDTHAVTFITLPGG